MRLGSSFLGMLLVLLQMLNPFLHAHAQGLSSQSGLHLHSVQGGYVADAHADAGAVCFKAGDVEHWVLGMPTAHRSGERSWFASDVAVITPSIFRFLPVEISRLGGFKWLLSLPPDWQLNDSLPPPALAPPII
jgi:hypothetical protein